MFSQAQRLYPGSQGLAAAQFEKIREEVLLWCYNGGTRNTVLSYPGRIRRNLMRQEVYNRNETKKYSVVYTKRAVVDTYDTRSYGY